MDDLIFDMFQEDGKVLVGKLMNVRKKQKFLKDLLVFIQLSFNWPAGIGKDWFEIDGSKVKGTAGKPSS